MKILVIDNYDSFTYNLVQLLGKIGKCGVIVKRNDETTVEEIRQMDADKILISPGPGKPESSRVSLDIICELGKEKPILGVCLGHQAIAVSFGARVVKSPLPVHGKTSVIVHDNRGVFYRIPQNFSAMRYHSLIVDEKTIPASLLVSARTEDGIIMALRHTHYPLEGIQFHPESVLSEYGEKLLGNWIRQ